MGTTKTDGSWHFGVLWQLAGRAGLDRAVTYTLLTRAWQAGAGAVNLLLIAKFFGPEVQGFYYTFSSLLALQVFVELGFYLVVVNLASHEWSKLRLDESGYIVGDASALSRLASLARFVVKWYSAASFLFVVGVGTCGYLFLAQARATDIAWQAPWWTVVVLATIQLWLMPILSLIEGCNQVVALNRFRLVQTIVDAFTIWLLLAVGTELWVAAGSLAVKVAATFVFLAISYRRFFRSLWAGAARATIQWRKEVWPMQWRLAAQGAVNYLVFSFFTPIMFHYHGPKVAGQMGMTLQIISVVQLMALAWVQTKVPRFGMLVANREYAELDRIWGQASRLSFGFAVVGSLAIWIAVVVLGEFMPGLATRVLGPLPTALFLLAYALMLIINYQAIYLRAHAREPFVFVGVSSGLLTGSLVFLFGSEYGPTGAATSYAAAVGLFVLPITTTIWIRRRADWQAR